MTAPVVVDPAPPDLATGLETLARTAGAARADARPLLLVAADLQVHPEALADLAEDPRLATAALVSGSGAARPDLWVRAGRVVAAATPAHRVADPGTAFAGALRVAVADLDAAEAAAADLATAARRHGGAGDPLGYLLLGLVRTGVPSTDRLKEFACYAGLAWGADAGRTGWLLAAAMITLQTARHTVDYTFTGVKDLREAEVVRAPLDQQDEPVRRQAGGVRAARAIELSRRSSAARPAVTWLKKVLHLGIGERWLVISVLAAAQQPLAALAVLLVLGAGSLLYTSAGRTLRARSWPAEPVLAREREIVLAQVDGGPLVPAPAAARFAGRPGGRERFLWVRPALLRAGEYLLVLGLTAGLAGAGPGAAVCVLLLVVASHHYDDLYRVLNRLRPPSALSRVLGLGVAGRLLVVAVLALLGARHDAVGEGGLWVLAGWLGILYLVAEPARVLREVRTTAGGPIDVPTEGAVGA